MPKKRHWARYSKPQSTAPHSLESSGLQSNLHHEEPQSRNVNELLASLRRASLATASETGSGSSLAAGPARLGSTHALAPAAAVSPSVPPEIAHILLPGSPPPIAHVPARPAAPAQQAHGGGAAALGPGVGAGGRRRAPAGPAPPPSWLSLSRHAPRRAPGAAFDASLRPPSGTAGPDELHASPWIDMPGLVRPAQGSLVDRTLRIMARDWANQKYYNQYYLIHLQGSLRAALVSYISRFNANGRGVSVRDLEALLLPPALPAPSATDDGAADADRLSDSEEPLPLPSPSTLNEDVRYLDLTGSAGRSISLKELGDLLFPRRHGATARSVRSSRPAPPPHGSSNDVDEGFLLDAWDSPGSVSFSPPRPLLPNLTHLSLALDPPPDPDSIGLQQAHVSWRQLLALAAHLPMLTHLSLAYWPEPTMMPNARLAAAAVSRGGGRLRSLTGRNSDSDWAEAVLLVRNLSKALYGLEYLDLTGCSSWAPALMRMVDNGRVDWVGNWGKVTTLVLAYGHDGGGHGIDSNSGEDDAGGMDGGVARRANAAGEAREIERHIRQQRAGQGRFITVQHETATT